MAAGRLNCFIGEASGDWQRYDVWGVYIRCVYECVSYALPYCCSPPPPAPPQFLTPSTGPLPSTPVAAAVIAVADTVGWPTDPPSTLQHQVRLVSSACSCHPAPVMRASPWAARHLVGTSDTSSFPPQATLAAPLRTVRSPAIPSLLPLPPTPLPQTGRIGLRE